MNRPSAPAIEDPDALANGQRFLDAHPELLPGVNALAGAQVTMPAEDDMPPKPKRSHAVKGRCLQPGCGKYYSAHRDGKCYLGSNWLGTVFTPGDPPAQREAAAPRPAFLSVEQVAHLDKLREAYFQAIEANAKAEQAMLDASANWYAYLDELKGAQ